MSGKSTRESLLAAAVRLILALDAAHKEDVIASGISETVKLAPKTHEQLVTALEGLAHFPTPMSDPVPCGRCGEADRSKGAHGRGRCTIF